MFFLQDNLSELSVEMAHIEHLQTDSLTAMLSYDTICNSYCISVNHLTAELQPSSLRSSSSSNLIVRRARRKIGDRAVAAPRVWNRLPTELKIMRSTPAFKRHLKTYLFSSVYGAS